MFLAQGAKLYRLFDMNISSEIFLPEAVLASDGAVDAEITRGELPETVRAAMQDAELWFGVMGPAEMWFQSPAALFYVRDGRHIRVQAQPDADENSLRAFLLGSALGFMMIQKGWYPVHGGSVVADGKVLIITGNSGAGKSTATTMLADRGLSFLADDVSVVRLENGQAMVLPAYPQRKLCKDAAVALGYDIEKMVMLNEERQKYAVRNAESWCEMPMPLGAIVEIVPAEAPELTLGRITGHDSLALFVRNLYRSFIHNYIGVQPQKMKDWLTIVSAVPLYQLKRPAEKETTDELASLLQRLAQGDIPPLA